MLYYPYISDKPNKKYFIITQTGHKVYFGAVGYEHYTDGHLDEKRRLAYIKRHKKREDWTNPNTPAYWSYRFLWLYPTKKEAYKHIKEELKKTGYI